MKDPRESRMPHSVRAEKLYPVVEEAILAPLYDSQEYVDTYLRTHMKRFAETIRLLQPIVHPDTRVVDVGSYGSLVPALEDVLGLKHVTITAPLQDNRPRSEDTILLDARNGGRYRFHVDRFDLAGPFPYADEIFDVVIFTEVLEHLAVDPLHTLSELSRVTRTGGWLLVSTPNCASAKSLLSILRGNHPYLYPIYTKQPSHDRHNREYVPWEVKELLTASGYELTSLTTVDVYGETLAERVAKAALRMTRLFMLKSPRLQNRGDTIFALGKKVSGVKDRYPAFLYT